MKRIIFLDFDGVLDTASYDDYLVANHLPEKDEFGVVFDPNCVAALATVIQQTGAQIVVSSTWKDFMSYRQLLAMWRVRNLPGYVIDVTPTVCSHRGNEIDQWLNECPVCCRYVIIDDMEGNNFNPHQWPYLLTVDPYKGIDQAVARQAIDILLSSDNLL